MLKDEITACCKALKLGQSLVENYDKVEAESHEEYLLQVLKLEVERRRANRKERRLKNAGFYAMKKVCTEFCVNGHSDRIVKLYSGGKRLWPKSEKRRYAKNCWTNF